MPPYLLAPTFNQSIDQTISKEGEEEDFETDHKRRPHFVGFSPPPCHYRATDQHDFLPFANSILTRCGRHGWFLRLIANPLLTRLLLNTRSLAALLFFPE